VTPPKPELPVTGFETSTIAALGALALLSGLLALRTTKEEK
jgi:LPXTG-motif cell wall-anchored protein